jgi:hypothetical protein
VPLVHYEWVEKCIDQGRLVGYAGESGDNWCLPAGLSLLQGRFIFRPPAEGPGARGLLQGACVGVGEWVGGLGLCAFGRRGRRRLFRRDYFSPRLTHCLSALHHDRMTGRTDTGRTVVYCSSDAGLNRDWKAVFRAMGGAFNE